MPKLVSISASWKNNQPDGFGVTFRGDDLGGIAKRIGAFKAQYAKATTEDIADMRRQCRYAGKHKARIAEIGWGEAACIVATLAAHNAMPLDDYNGMEYAYVDDDEMIVKGYPLHN